MAQPTSNNQTTNIQLSQANLATGNMLLKYNVKNGNFTFKAAGKNLNGQSLGRSDARKMDSNRANP